MTEKGNLIQTLGVSSGSVYVVERSVNVNYKKLFHRHHHHQANAHPPVLEDAEFSFLCKIILLLMIRQQSCFVLSSFMSSFLFSSLLAWKCTHAQKFQTHSFPLNNAVVWKSFQWKQMKKLYFLSENFIFSHFRALCSSSKQFKWKE